MLMWTLTAAPVLPAFKLGHAQIQVLDVVAILLEGVTGAGFNYTTLTASSDAADAIKDAFRMRVNCLWTVTGLCLSHAVKPSYRG